MIIPGSPTQLLKEVIKLLQLEVEILTDPNIPNRHEHCYNTLINVSNDLNEYLDNPNNQPTVKNNEKT